MNGIEILAMVVIASLAAGCCWMISWLGRLTRLLAVVRRHLAATRGANAHLVERRLEVEAERDKVRERLAEAGRNIAQAVEQRLAVEAERDQLKALATALADGVSNSAAAAGEGG